MKKIVSLLLVFTLIFSSFAFASAEQKYQPKVTIKEGVVVPDNVIQDLVRENPNVGQITILEYGTCNKNELTSDKIENDITPNGIFTKTYYDVKKTVTKTDICVKDELVISVAKGQSVTLEEKWSGSLSSNISGEISSAKLDITSKISKSYSATVSFAGPPENSKKNCRKYKVKFYEQQGTYIAKWHQGSVSSGTLKYGTENGTFSEPTHYLCYSTDVYLEENK